MKSGMLLDPKFWTFVCLIHVTVCACYCLCTSVSMEGFLLIFWSLSHVRNVFSKIQNNLQKSTYLEKTIYFVSQSLVPRKC